MTDERPFEDRTIAARASSGVIWLTLQVWLSRLGGFITVAILARLLTPTDFGLVTIAGTILPIVYLIADLGFTTYIVQASGVDRRVVSTAFWFSSCAGLILALAVAALGPALGVLFGAPDAAPVIIAMAPVVLIVAVSSTPIALLRRDMRFRTLSVQAAIAGIVGQVVAIVLALIGAGVWALIAQVFAVQSITAILAWITARWRPQFAFSAGDFRRMLGFGVNVVAIDLASTVRLWVENAAISRVLSSASLGAYGVASRLVQTAKDLAGSAIAPVSMVAFAKVRDDPARLIGGYGRSLRLSYSVMVPGMVFLLVAAPAVVPLLFGPQWSQSVAPVQALAVAGVFAQAAALDHGLFYGMGRPGLWLRYAIVVEVVSLIVTLTLVHEGLFAVAAGYAGVAILATITRWFLVARLLQVGAGRILVLSMPPLAAAAISTAIGALAFWAVGGLPHLVQIVITGIAVVLAQAAAVRLLMPATFRELVGYAMSRMHRKESRVV
jgi:O-antigen/teichoic acid export membrane protein